MANAQLTSRRDSPTSAGWAPSAVPDVLVKLDRDRHIVEFRLDRDLEPRDIKKVSEAAAFARVATPTIRNWKRSDPAFPLKKMGGLQVVIWPFFQAYLLHADA